MSLNSSCQYSIHNIVLGTLIIISRKQKIMKLTNFFIGLLREGQVKNGIKILSKDYFSNRNVLVDCSKDSLNCLYLVCFVHSRRKRGFCAIYVFLCLAVILKKKHKEKGKEVLKK